jgi:hypothetical protein
MFYCWLILWLPCKLYKKLTTNNFNNNITKFGENNKIYNFRLLSVICYKNNGHHVKIEDTRNVYDLIDKDDYKFSLITHSVNEIVYKVIIYENEIRFPIYETISVPIFIRKIQKALIKIEDKEHDITKVLLNFIGPEYNFYSNIGINMKLEDILFTDGIQFINLSDGFVELHDNLGIINKYNLPWSPKWNPTIIS